MADLATCCTVCPNPGVQKRKCQKNAARNLPCSMVTLNKHGEQIAERTARPVQFTLRFAHLSNGSNGSNQPSTEPTSDASNRAMQAIEQCKQSSNASNQALRAIKQCKRASERASVPHPHRPHFMGRAHGRMRSSIHRGLRSRLHVAPLCLSVVLEEGRSERELE